MENLVDYSRQNDLDQALGFEKIRINVIIGCGGVGFWLGIMLAMNGFSNFILFDADKLEVTNLNRIPVPPIWVGTNKAVALRRIITMLRPNALVKVYTHHIKADNLELIKKIAARIRTGVGLMVWDTTDNAIDQKEIHNMCKKHRYAYRKLGYEGFTVGSYHKYDIWTANGYEPGYRTTRANSCTSAIAAGIGIFSAQLNNADVVVDLEDLIAKGGYENE